MPVRLYTLCQDTDGAGQQFYIYRPIIAEKATVYEERKGLVAILLRKIAARPGLRKGLQRKSHSKPRSGL
jgi:hypothetical protein